MLIMLSTTNMHKFTVTIQHVSWPHIRETYPMSAKNIDDAYEKAYRLTGNWFQVVNVESKTCKN